MTKINTAELGFEKQYGKLLIYYMATWMCMVIRAYYEGNFYSQN